MESQVVFIIILLLASAVSCYTELTLSVNEGNRIFIPCFKTQEQSIAQWKLNGIGYPLFTLQTEYRNRIQVEDDGLVIHIVSLYLIPEYESNTSLRTVKYTCCEQGQSISSVILTINEKSGDYDNDGLQTDYSTRLRLQVTAGSTVYIPCHGETELATIWEIDGKLYTFLNLPAYHKQYRGGIIATNISVENTGDYKCYSTRSNNNRLQYHYTVSIMVDNNDGITTGQGHLNFLELGIRHDQSSMTEKSREVHIQIRTGSDQCLRQGNLVFSMNINGSIINGTSDGKFSVSIDLIEHNFAKVSIISAISECTSQLEYKFRILDHNTRKCIQEGEMVCILLPQNLAGVAVVFPSEPNSDKYCECGLFSDATDLSFQNYECIKEGTRVYIADDNQLCFTNITLGANNMFLLARDTGNAESSEIFRTYESITKVFVEGPARQKQYIYGESSIQDEYIVSIISPINSQETNVTISDITGVIILNNISSRTSLKIPSSCAQSCVNATANIYCTTSMMTAYFEVPHHQVGDICDCIKAKVSIGELVFFMNTSSNEVYINLGVTCTSGYPVTGIVLEVEQEDEKSVSVPLQLICDQTNRNIRLNRPRYTLNKKIKATIVWRIAHTIPQAPFECQLKIETGSACSIWSQNMTLWFLCFYVIIIKL